MKDIAPQFSREQFETAKKKLNKVNQQYIEEVNSIVGKLVGKKYPLRIYDITSSIKSCYSLDSILDCFDDYTILDDE